MMPQEPLSNAGFVQGFPPIVGDQPRILILGSAPSVASLEKQQYYGKPQNAFWRIMGELFGAGRELPYEQRINILADAGIAIITTIANPAIQPTIFLYMFILLLCYWRCSKPNLN